MNFENEVKEAKKWKMVRTFIFLVLLLTLEEGKDGFIFCVYGRNMRLEDELCREIRPTKIHIPQSKIRPDFIPNLANFPN